MQVHILPFGVLKERLGSSSATLDLQEGATVADLLHSLSLDHSSDLDVPRPQAEGSLAPWLKSIAVSVNAEYASPGRVLHEGDEVGLLPPVSGGCGANSSPGRDRPFVTAALTREVIDADTLVADAKRGEDGAVVVFDGIVRNHSRGRQTIHLDYEAYEEMAIKQIEALSLEAIARFRVRHVTLVHRLGRLNVGETSVLIVVASAHRAQAFDACRWLIDTLKKTVPIWKKETFVDGVVWADGEPFPDGIALAPPGGPHDA